tara:strand:+ start:6074 stop:6376 length:303 start_codon:yes stop_codon:yes gene_type:complete
MEYKFNKSYFLSNESDVFVYGKHVIQINSNSTPSKKILSALYNAKKAYVTLEGDDVVKKEVLVDYNAAPQKVKTTKKVKIDEPKESKSKTTATKSSKEKS